VADDFEKVQKLNAKKDLAESLLGRLEEEDAFPCQLETKAEFQPYSHSVRKREPLRIPQKARDLSQHAGV